MIKEGVAAEGVAAAAAAAAAAAERLVADGPSCPSHQVAMRSPADDMLPSPPRPLDSRNEGSQCGGGRWREMSARPYQLHAALGPGAYTRQLFSST